MSKITLWKHIWLSQKKRCAKCNKKVRLEDTAKSSYSLKIVCQECYNKPLTMGVLDEWSDYS